MLTATKGTKGMNNIVYYVSHAERIRENRSTTAHYSRHTLGNPFSDEKTAALFLHDNASRTTAITILPYPGTTYKVPSGLFMLP